MTPLAWLGVLMVAVGSLGVAGWWLDRLEERLEGRRVFDWAKDGGL